MHENYEEFSDSQKEILERYVTNTSSNVFCLRNLPEVIKGALFSRYSRSSLGLRSLLFKEFILSEEAAFHSIVGDRADTDGEIIEDQIVAIKKAQNFFDRILDGYGDDSIGELGGAHLALEQISMLGAKAVEDCRIGGSPLEKSTRYIYFDQKIDGEYQFYREPVLMTSAYRKLYLDTCNRLFTVYSELIPPLTEALGKKFPQEPDVSKVAYTAALRAKVLDCLRGLLPASALTNMGVYGNGRFFEGLIRKLHFNSLSEMQEIGKKSYTELAKVIPSFVRRSDLSHRHHLSFSAFNEKMNEELKNLSDSHCPPVEKMGKPGVRLLDYDPKSPAKVAAALLFPHCQSSLVDLDEYCAKLPKDEVAQILEAAATHRENRRHKSPRALEFATVTFEIVADFGIYRDLQRHRILSQERQLLTCDYGYYVPADLEDEEMQQRYREVIEEAKEAYDTIATEFPEEAQYIVPMAYNMHWYFHVNLRALQWLCELRSAPAGHPAYRFVAQEMAKQVSTALPQFERFFSFVDYEGHELGRLGQEVRIIEKKKQKVSS